MATQKRVTTKKGSETLPARTTPEPPRELAPDASPVEVTTALVKAHWGSVLDLPEGSGRAIARTLHDSFPMWGPYQFMQYFDILGGDFYLNAEGYYDVAAAHPMTEEPPVWFLVKPETPEWDEFIGSSMNPEDIAAGYICEYKRRDRAIPFREFNYCLKSDELLREWTGPKGSRKRALRIDWEPLARKIARTRSARRVLRTGLSLTEAAERYAQMAVAQILEEAERKALPKPVVSPDDPYSDKPEPRPEPEVTTAPPESVFESIIVEPDRRYLFKLRDDRDLSELSDDPNEALKFLMQKVYAEMGDPKDIGEISTTKLTYKVYFKVRDALSLFPYKDRETVEVEAEVVDTGEQGELL
jgi:hypothetical protein